MECRDRRLGVVVLMLGLLVQGCPSGGGSGTGSSVPPGNQVVAPAPDAGSDAARASTQGGLVMYTHGSRVGLEHFRDDGASLVSWIAVLNSAVEVTLSRSPRRVAVRPLPHGEQRPGHDLPPDTVGMESGGGQ